MGKLNTNDEQKVRNIIEKVKNAKTIKELNLYNNELKRIDAKNRRKEITKRVLHKYKRGI